MHESDDDLKPAAGILFAAVTGGLIVAVVALLVFALTA